MEALHKLSPEEARLEIARLTKKLEMRKRRSLQQQREGLNRVMTESKVNTTPTNFCQNSPSTPSRSQSMTRRRLTDDTDMKENSGSNSLPSSPSCQPNTKRRRRHQESLNQNQPSSSPIADSTEPMESFKANPLDQKPCNETESASSTNEPIDVTDHSSKQSECRLCLHLNPSISLRFDFDAKDQAVVCHGHGDKLISNDSTLESLEGVVISPDTFVLSYWMPLEKVTRLHRFRLKEANFEQLEMHELPLKVVELKILAKPFELCAMTELFAFVWKNDDLKRPSWKIRTHLFNSFLESTQLLRR